MHSAKTRGESEVAGRANVLIFPDLHAGNIGYKPVQQFTGAKAIGPLLQGFTRPVADRSYCQGYYRGRCSPVRSRVQRYESASLEQRVRRTDTLQTENRTWHVNHQSL